MLRECALLTALLPASACSAARAADELAPLALERFPECDEPEPALPRWLVAGCSVEGRALEYALLGGGERVVLLLATIHGDEPAGTPLLHALVRHLAEHGADLAGASAIVLPLANPDGRERATRRNARGVDLNRNFPARNFAPRAGAAAQPLSEPESRAVHALVLRHAPVRIVSLHQGAAGIDYDGPAAELAAALAAAGPLAVRRLGARPGSLGSWAGVDQGLPIVTLELPRGAERASADELWARYGGLLLEAVRFRETP